MEFFDYYEKLFGDRWPLLLGAMKGECSYEKLQFDQYLEPYYLDKASVFVARTLSVERGMGVLDMCAAPGGKSLVLASMLKGEGFLICNDRSIERRKRLEHVLENTLPENFRKIIEISGYDGSKFGLYKKNFFDRILLDAPCSSDRHVLNSEEHLKVWSLKRVKRLAIEQGSLLASAIDALKVGGSLVYSTCALSPLENDLVVSRILKKRKHAKVVPIEEIPEGAERLEFGVHILPDKTDGSGPIYCAKITVGN